MWEVGYRVTGTRRVFKFVLVLKSWRREISMLGANLNGFDN